MGEVFRGVDTGLNRRVAIKILSEKHKDSPELRARFVREGRAVAAISHPNVVQVFATGSWDERPYIAMELLDGIDLGSTVEKTGPLDSLSAARVAIDAAHGLAAAAKAGLIHRDVKPSNLVRVSDGQVKVTDFGLAKPVDPGSEPALTAMGVVVGTPDYIAPEQARGETIDERVDIYALGGTLYFLLTGVPPYRTGKPAEDKYLKVVARHLRSPPPDAAQANPAVDRELSELVKLMMAKKPADRPSYDELIEQLGHVLGRLARVSSVSMQRGRPPTRPPTISERRPSTLEGSATISEGDIAAQPVESHGLPTWLVALTLACIALFVAGLVVYLRRSDDGSASGPSTSATPRDAAPPLLDTATARPGPPIGMLVVKKADGAPWFYADTQPTAVAAFRRVFASHDQPGKPADPVVMVSYNEARSFAKTRGGRLLTSDEWTAASVTPGFVVADGLLEWVDSPEETKKIVRQHGKSLIRPDAPQKDVTFRMAKDL